MNYAAHVSPVGNVEARQIIGSITEEVQQGEAGLRHHLGNRLVAVTLGDDQTAATLKIIALQKS